MRVRGIGICDPSNRITPYFFVVYVNTDDYGHPHSLRNQNHDKNKSQYKNSAPHNYPIRIVAVIKSIILSNRQYVNCFSMQ